MVKVLVAYASKHNSTAEIADTIGAVLQQTGDFEVDIRSAETIDDITPYEIIVLGSAIYAGQWQPAAARFLKDYESQLAQRQVWLFSSGPTGEGDPTELLKGWEMPQALEPVVQRIQPQGVALFHGKLDPATLNYFERLLVRGVKAPTGDFRDWDMIRDWAAGIAAHHSNS